MKLHSQPIDFSIAYMICNDLLVKKSWLKIESALTPETLIQVKVIKPGFWIFSIIAGIGNVKQILSVECRTDS